MGSEMDIKARVRWHREEKCNEDCVKATLSSQIVNQYIQQIHMGTYYLLILLLCSMLYPPSHSPPPLRSSVTCAHC